MHFFEILSFIQLNGFQHPIIGMKIPIDNELKKRKNNRLQMAKSIPLQNEPLCLSFNQEANCISVGTQDGFAIYNCEPFGKCFQEDIGGVGIAEMLYCTSLVALVGSGDQPAFSPRRLRVWNTKTRSGICDLNFISAVLGVRMNNQRLVSILERKIYIFDISSMKMLTTLDTSRNPKALCVLSPHENSHLAFPSGATPGEIVIYDANNLSVLNAFQAHRSAPVTMAFNATGTLLATASEAGTLIRVFSVPGGKKVASFRRGSYTAQIYCLAFNETSTILCASSETGTVHFFSLSGTESSATGSFGHFAPISSTISSGVSSLTAAAMVVNGVSVTALSSKYANGNSSSHVTDNNSQSVLSQPNQNVQRPNNSASRNSGSGADLITDTISTYLPPSMAGIAEGTRDFAFARLRRVGVPNICAIHGPKDQNNPIVQLYVATSDGYFCEYSLALKQGGEGRLVREHVLRNSTSEEINAGYIS